MASSHAKKANINKAKRMYQNKDYVQALKMVLACVNTQPTSEAYTLAAKCYVKLGEYEQAPTILEKAIALDASNHEAWFVLSIVYSKQNKLIHAILAANKAAEINKEQPDGYHIHLTRLVQRWDHNIFNESIYNIADKYLHLSGISYWNYYQIWRSNVLLAPQTQKIQKLLSLTNYDDFKKEVETSNYKAELLNSFFLRGLQVIQLCDLDFEYLYTNLRRYMLNLIADGKFDDTYIPLLSALSCQCFLNEYVLSVSPSESELIDQIEARLGNDSDELNVAEILLYSCYKPLNELENAHDVADKYKDDEAASVVIKEQILDYLTEQDIKESLVLKTDIDDEVSKKVRSQYEANPYPRWSSTSVLKDRDFDTSFFRSADIDFKNVLVAGCGTGMHLFDLMYQYPQAQFSAFDLSSSSLAYALRKHKELDLKKVDLFQADILNLYESHHQKYDLISCTGTLHHLENPIEGWAALKKLLKPGGYMHIGLYSQPARHSVNEAREWIRQQDYKATTEDILRFREHVKTLPKPDPISAFLGYADFYSTSMCRDLCFHVQEHQYTAQRLKEEIDELGLTFLKMNSPSSAHLKRYKELFPGSKSMDNLDNIDVFEKQYPEAFIGMYQFWVKSLD